MAEKKGLVDYGIQVLRALLGEKAEASQPAPAPVQKKTIEDITIDQLSREQVRLEQEKKRILSEIRQIESTKRKLFEEGVKNASERERLAIAREIKSLDMKAQNKDHMLQAIEKQRQIIDGLAMIKERTRMLSESGLAGVVGNIDLGDLITYVDRASVDGEFQMKKFDEIIRTLGQVQDLAPQSGEDPDVLEIMKQMEAASAASDSPEALNEHFNRLDQVLAERSRQREATDDEL